jgi:hypothetical protein
MVGGKFPTFFAEVLGNDKLVSHKIVVTSKELDKLAQAGLGSLKDIAAQGYDHVLWSFYKH